MSKAERLLSYSLLSLITSKPLATAPTTGISDEDGSYSDKARGLMNSDGAWCWRERCDCELLAVPNQRCLTSESPIPACLKLTKAMQKTCDTLQIVADLYDDHVSIRLSLQGVLSE
jgi:sorting nexin-9/18/33